MSIGIFVLESSIVDFAGAVVAVAPDGAGVTFDGPHLHPAADRAGSIATSERKRTFVVGSDAPDFARALGEIRRILRSIAVPLAATRPIVNSDGITIRQFIVKDSDKVDILIPKVLSGLSLGSPEGLVCAHGTHLALRSLAYGYCPIDGTPMAASGRRGIFETFLKEKFRISEVRVEEGSARKTCRGCQRLLPNVFARCPGCGKGLHVERPEGAR